MLIEDSVAQASEVVVGATPADVRSVQVKSDVGSQGFSRDVDARQEETDGVAEVVLGLSGQLFAAVADVVVVASPAQAEDDSMAKVERPQN